MLVRRILYQPAEVHLPKSLTLFTGVKRTWSRLINAESGISSTVGLGPEFAALPSQVAGMVPQGSKEDGGWKAEEWCSATVCGVSDFWMSLSWVER